MRIATAPGTWGIEPPAANPANPPWQAVLDQIVAAGFDGTELGPLGYLPNGVELRAVLHERGLALAGGFLMEPLSSGRDRERIEATARRTCKEIAGAGGATLVLIDGLDRERSATAGDAERARRLPPVGWARLIDCASAVAQIAQESGLAVAFHPHAGTHVEFGDEIERLFSDLDLANVGLCLDSGHALYAGLDPIALLKTYRDRIAHVHLKDVDLDALERVRLDRLSFEAAVAAGVFTPLGAGKVDLTGLIEALRALRYAGWATFEQDRTLETFEQARPDAEASLAHIRAIEEEL